MIIQNTNDSQDQDSDEDFDFSQQPSEPKDDHFILDFDIIYSTTNDLPDLYFQLFDAKSNQKIRNISETFVKIPKESNTQLSLQPD